MAPKQPVLEVLEDFVPEKLRTRVWEAVSENRWYFGHQSTPDSEIGFWKMNLDGNHATDRIWTMVRPRCEELSMGRLAVLRQYANGHTYGLGGDSHVDDLRPGTFTLLYYPMLEWKLDWGGETVFHNSSGEIVLAVMPKPGRAVFFDSRILHAGRPPSRSYGGVRITIAWKLRLENEEAASL